MKISKLALILTLIIASPSFAGETVIINMKSLSYDKKETTIVQGQFIVWKNTAHTNHSATAEDKTFDTGMIAPGKESKPILFKDPGTHKYHCSLHGETMSGTIIVKADH